MQISLSFSPKEDDRNHVVSVVDAVFGVKSPNVQAGQTAQPSPVSVAQTPGTALPLPAAATENLSLDAAPAAIADFPNAMIAPTAVAPSVATHSAAGVQLDKNGIPWDARIHSGGLNDDGSHKQNKDGSWAKRKGVSDLEVSNITKELQNLMAATIGNGQPPAGLPAGGVLGNPANVPHQEAVAVPGQPDAFVIAPVIDPQALPVTATAAMAQAGAPVALSAEPNAPHMPAQGLPAGVAPMPTAQVNPADFASLAQAGSPVPLAPNIAPMPIPMPAAQVIPADSRAWHNGWVRRCKTPAAS